MTNTQLNPVNVVGSIYGLAVGDAYGDPIEFQRRLSFDGKGPSAPDEFRITDDTQMSIYVWRAIEAWDGKHLGLLRQELAVEFDCWFIEQHKGWSRAPGATCMGALGTLHRQGLGYWQQATSHKSAGCGSVMRAPWVGLHPKVTDEQLFSIAAMQAVLTHGPAENPFAAAALTALTRAIVRGEVDPGEASEFLYDWVAEHEGMDYDTIALGTILWKLAVTSDGQKHHDSSEDYVTEGINHVHWIAEHAASLTAGLKSRPLFSFDPADLSGEGWRARECVALAVGVFDADLGFVDSIRAAAWTRGDSDSTAAITGALAGAHAGASNIPTEWTGKLEDRYMRELREVSEQGMLAAG